MKRQQRQTAERVDREIKEYPGVLLRDYGPRRDREGTLLLDVALFVPAVSRRPVHRHNKVGGDAEARLTWCKDALSTLAEIAEHTHREPPAISATALDAAVGALLDDYQQQFEQDETRARRAADARMRAGVTEGYPCTDVGNAARLAAAYGRDLLWAPGLEWLHWDGKRWVQDTTGYVLHLAARVSQLIRGELGDLLDGADGRRLHPEEEARAAELDAWATACEQAGRIKAAADLLVTRRELHAAVEDLDADPLLLNSPTGTINLRTGQCRLHDRRDRLTKLAGVGFDAAATCPTFDAFLETVQRTADIRQYLQRYFGYCSTGSTKEQEVHIFWGSGANGKSTLTGAIRTVLADYASGSRIETFLARRDGSDASNDLAMLRGRRLVLINETEDNQELAMALIKRTTGGESLLVRYLYKEFFEYLPEFKLLLSTNHKPKVTDPSHAAWRRIRLVPFTILISDHDQDKELPQKLQAEAAGILNWLVAGALEWQRQGLAPPLAVLVATKGYRDEMDTVSKFLAQCTDSVAGARTQASLLYGIYRSWCTQEGETALDVRAFKPQVATAGYAQKHMNGGNYWLDLGVLEDAPRPETAFGGG
jgi:putative DNA primase/helicase